tara:strand:- start:4125 stop:4367 length:243 start_codon:yes stop_codon:yes gene_type:complete
MILHDITIPRPIAIYAMNQLSNADYNVATRISEGVAEVVKWSYDQDIPIIAKYSIGVLDNLDKFGSSLISIVVWIINHTP